VITVADLDFPQGDHTAPGFSIPKSCADHRTVYTRNEVFMPSINFERFESTQRVLNPFNAFAEEEHRVEVRKDPLLHDTSVYNPYLKDKAKAFFGQNDEELIRKLAEDTAANCIFCEDSVRTKTACYPEDLVPGGRMEQGEAVLFANLFSLAPHHPVIVLSKAHFLRPKEITPVHLGDGLYLARLYLKEASERDPALSFATVNVNYLQPAGASLVHPHMQMLATQIPYTYHGRLLDGVSYYLLQNGTHYFADLIAEERSRRERYIARHGAWHWIAAFSPQGSNEIMAIHDEESDLGRITVKDLRDLSDGITRVLALYEERGLLSFNFTLYSAKGGETVGFRCLFRIVNRQNLYPNYRNDDYFLQKMLQTELILNLPEDLAAEARKRF
jgi:UDPglucose--hexose-1-phosphate uridylyltransferase